MMSLTSLRNALTRSRSARAKRARKASRRMAQSRMLRCEALEDRRMLSVVPNDPLFPNQWLQPRQQGPLYIGPC